MEMEKFESWAIIEIFGHTQIAGKVTEASIGGCSFVRVDVPECNGEKAFTKFYGNGAIYSMTPCSEDVARAALKSIRPAPVNIMGGPDAMYQGSSRLFEILGKYLGV